MARTELEEELLAMVAAEKQRNASNVSSPGLPDLPPGLFGEDLNTPRIEQASSDTPDSYLDFLRPTSPDQSVADVGLDSLWEPQVPAHTAADNLSSLWSTPESASDVEPELQSLWDSSGRTAIAEDTGDALSNLFMNRDAMAQAEMVGQPMDYGDIPMPETRSASRGNEFTIEFDTEFNFDGPMRTAARSPRFRVDQAPPPRRTFDSRVSSQADGVVVGQRGATGRFAQTPPVQRVEQIARYETKVASQESAPAPRSTSTTYDVIRRGGLDL